MSRCLAWPARARPEMSCLADLNLAATRHRHAQCVRHVTQPSVGGPRLGAARQSRRGEQVDVDMADAAPEQGVTITEAEDFRVRGDYGGRQVQEGGQDGLTLAEDAQRKFADDQGVRQNPPDIEQYGQCRVARPQMIDPDRRVYEDHDRADRRLGGAMRLGSLPPRRASRRALSRSIRAFSASRMRLDFSSRP